jgi:hypothetical protein
MIAEIEKMGDNFLLLQNVITENAILLQVIIPNNYILIKSNNPNITFYIDDQSTMKMLMIYSTSKKYDDLFKSYNEFVSENETRIKNETIYHESVGLIEKLFKNGDIEQLTKLYQTLNEKNGGGLVNERNQERRETIDVGKEEIE